VNASTPAGDPATDSTTDTTARHGDVDRNGDLVDKLDGIAAARHELAAELDNRLRGAITAATPDLAEAQLNGVKQMLRPWTVTLAILAAAFLAATSNARAASICQLRPADQQCLIDQQRICILARPGQPGGCRWIPISPTAGNRPWTVTR
jgi:hypothetical protein